jgi:hypothetical protein
VFENRVPRRICRHKREEVAEGWRRLHDELHNLCSSHIVRVMKSRMRWAGHVTRMGKIRNVYKITVGKSEGNRPLGKPRRIWDDVTKTDLGETGWERVDWMHLAQDRDKRRALVNTVMNLRVP